MAVADPWYTTAQNTALTVTSNDTPLVANDWDAEGDVLSASVVANPAHGALSNFQTDGTFTYTPTMGFTGIDTFSYKVNDGTGDSNVVEAAIAVGGHFGPQTNPNQVLQDGTLTDGALLQSQTLTPGQALVYQSNTVDTRPIIMVETSLRADSSVPDEIRAQLTFNGTAGTTYSYSTTGLSPGDPLRFALQADASTLATGRYDWSLKLSAVFSGTPVDHTYAGSYDLVNRDGSGTAFGRGWQLAGVDQLVTGTAGAMLVDARGATLWFGADGTGGYLHADGDSLHQALVQNQDQTFTLTDKHGTTTNFSTAGQLTSAPTPTATRSATPTPAAS